MVKCTTCQDTKTVDYETNEPPWPYKPGEAPNQILRGLECPDCVHCVQCDHPNYDGIHTCRLFDPGGRWLPKGPLA